MLIVALQDDVDSLYAIWDTVTDRFLGVNLDKYEAAGIIMEYKGNYTHEAALDRVKHPQPFSDIAEHLCDKTCKLKEENEELKAIIDKKLGGWISYCEKHESKDLSFKLLCDMFEICIDYDKLIEQLKTLYTRCHEHARDSFNKGNYGALHIVTADELK